VPRRRVSCSARIEAGAVARTDCARTYLQNLTIDKAVEVLLTCTPPDLSLTSFRAKVVTEVMTDATAKVPSARPTITQIFEKVKTWQDIKASAVGETHGKCECSVS